MKRTITGSLLALAAVLSLNSQAAEVTDSWTDGAGASLRTFALTTTVTRLVAPAESPLLVLDDLWLQARIDYATPQLSMDWNGEPTTTTTDYVRFGGPLNLIVMAVTVALAPLIWPFRP